MSDNAIETIDLTKRFGEFTAVDQVNFTVKRGEIFGFLGPNGAGKTTTMRMLMGLIQPTSGSAKVLGSRFPRRLIASWPSAEAWVMRLFHSWGSFFRS